MKDFTYVTKNEVAVKNYTDALTLAEILLDNGYVVMISREEKLYIINYIWSQRGCDRNDVVFQDRDIVEDEIFNTKGDEE